MNKKDQIKNIVAFSLILLGDNAPEIFDNKFSPDYLMEQFKRYILSDKSESNWGLHPHLKSMLNMYIEKWAEELND